MKKLLILTLVLTLVSPASFVHAEEASTTLEQPVSSDASENTGASTTEGQTELPVPTASEAIDTNLPPVDLQATSTELQDTTNTQPAVTGEMLEGTLNPEAAPSDDAETIPVEDASTTIPQIPVEPDPIPAVPLEDATSTPESVAKELLPENEITPAEPAPQIVALPEKDLTPDPQFAFALTGKSIPSKKVIKDREGKAVGEQTISNVAQTQIDNASGVISVSGQCSDVYFVILLYRNQNDYADDPSSYLVNRAYPCVSGTYSYSIDELPHNLQNGQYYLLVGQEGNTGTWTPITGLTEITINRN